MNRLSSQSMRNSAVWTSLSLALVATLIVALTAGCGFGTSAGANAADEPVPGARISGIAHGGQQPIAGATVQLWAVGSTGYGSAATPLISATCTTSDGTSTSDANANVCNTISGTGNALVAGAFVITGDYTCPNPPSNSTLGTGNALVYLTVTGGNSGSGTNTASNLVAALGPCGNLTSSTFITVNEITTAATAYSLGQFYGAGTGSFGAPNTTQAQIGINNAFTTSYNLVNTSTGTAITSQTLTNSGLSVTSTPESAKLISIANILASCVNSTGVSSAACSTLLADAISTSNTAAADTLQAAVNMSLNPTSSTSATTVGNATSAANMLALYGLISGTPAFTGGLSAQPADWTLGIQYTSNVAEGTTSPLNYPQGIGIDSNGNVWVLNANAAAHDNITQLSPNGTPNLIALAYTSGQIRNMAIDTNNNVYWGTSSSPSGFWKYNGSTTSAETTTFGSAYGLTIGPTNDVYFTRTSSSCAIGTSYGIGELYASTPASLVQFGCSSTAPNNKYAAIDKNNQLWLTQGSSAATVLTTGAMPTDSTVSSTCGSFPCNGLDAQPTYTTITGGTGSVPALGNAYGLAVGLGGTNIWIPNSTLNTVSELTSTTTGSSFGSAAAFNSPYGIAVDGAGHLWVTNRNTAAISELDNSGNILSPQTSGTTPVNVLGFAHSSFSAPWGVGIDPSGNVWVANNADNSAGTVIGGVVELVGAGAPTVTPVAQALYGTVNSTGHGIGQMP